MCKGEHRAADCGEALCQEHAVPLALGCSEVQESLDVRERSLSLWRQAVLAAPACALSALGISRDGVAALLEDKEDGRALCLLGPTRGDGSPPRIAHAGRGTQSLTGHHPGFARGRSIAEWLGLKEGDLEVRLNEEEEVALQSICDGSVTSSPDFPVASLLCLHQRSSGQRFWNFMRVSRVEVDQRPYVLCTMSDLPIALPLALRNANEEGRSAAQAQSVGSPQSAAAMLSRIRNPNKAVQEEEEATARVAYLAEFLEKLRIFLSQTRSVLRRDSADHDAARASLTTSMLSYMKSNTTEFEGDHYVPMTGEIASDTFKREVRWVGILNQVRNSLYRLYLSAEDSEEVVACAVSDPTAEDCPLVYISSEFEKLTGYSRHFAVGRNCRFLQPNHAFRNRAFNGEELLRMRGFCSRPQPPSTRTINLLVNENTDGYPFWNLLMMEHIRVPVDPARNCGEDHRCYIFAVQTNLSETASRICEILSMDPDSIRELQRLRAVLRENEPALGTSSMQGYASMCLAQWAAGLPSSMSQPRLQFVRPETARRVKDGIPVLGVELTHDNIMQHFGHCLLDGVRHFYLTFPRTHGACRDDETDQIDVQLMVLKLSNLFNTLKTKFLHYLRKGVAFSLVTPPSLVPYITQVLRANAGYTFAGWMLDLRNGGEKDPYATAEFAECWQIMSGVCRDGGVQFLGICESAEDPRRVFDRACARIAQLQKGRTVARAEDMSPISLMGFDLSPLLHPSQLKILQKCRSLVSVVALNPCGPHHQLRSAAPVVSMAEEHGVDPEVVLMQWAASCADAISYSPVGRYGSLARDQWRSARRRVTMAVAFAKPLVVGNDDHAEQPMPPLLRRTTRASSLAGRADPAGAATWQDWTQWAVQDIVMHRRLVDQFVNVCVERIGELPSLLDPSASTKAPAAASGSATSSSPKQQTPPTPLATEESAGTLAFTRRHHTTPAVLSSPPAAAAEPAELPGASGGKNPAAGGALESPRPSPRSHNTETDQPVQNSLPRAGGELESPRPARGHHAQPDQAALPPLSPRSSTVEGRGGMRSSRRHSTETDLGLQLFSARALYAPDAPAPSARSLSMRSHRRRCTEQQQALPPLKRAAREEATPSSARSAGAVLASTFTPRSARKLAPLRSAQGAAVAARHEDIVSVASPMAGGPEDPVRQEDRRAATIGTGGFFHAAPGSEADGEIS